MRVRVRSLCERYTLIFVLLTASAMDNISETIDTSYEINATFYPHLLFHGPSKLCFLPRNAGGFGVGAAERRRAKGDQRAEGEV